MLVILSSVGIKFRDMSRVFALYLHVDHKEQEQM